MRRACRGAGRRGIAWLGRHGGGEARRRMRAVRVVSLHGAGA